MGDFREFLIEDIMPARELHLVGGPSGAGKTRLTLQGVPQFMSGGIWLGKRVVRPLQVFYLSCDRSGDSFRRNLDFFGLAEDSFPWRVLSELPLPTRENLPLVLGWIKKESPLTDLVIVDGFTSLVPFGKINDYKIVSSFLVETQKALQRSNLTLLGLVHTAKVKESEVILNPRQKIAGSVAMAAYSDLIVLINPEDDRSPENPNRVVHVLPRNSAEYTIPMEMREGRLEEIDAGGALEDATSLLEGEPEGTAYTTASLKRLARGVPHATFERWLREQVSLGLLSRVGRGRYERV